MKRDLKMMDFKDGKREKKIIKTAFIGIITNFFLAGAKNFYSHSFKLSCFDIRRYK